MKKIVLVCVLFTNWMNAQITVNSSSFPTVGDTIRVSVGMIQNQDFSSTGESFIWDFSALVPDSQRVTDYRPVSETNLFLVQPYFGSFADVDHQASYYTLIPNLALAPDTASGGLSFENTSLFSKLSTTALTNVGFSVEISGFPVAVPSDTIETVYPFPLDYGNTWSSKGYSAIDLTGLNLAFKQFRTRESVVDGWGNITTPYGSFDVLRVKHIIHEIDSFMIEVDTVVGPEWFGFELPEQHDYEWIAANDKEPILRISTTLFAGFENISSITYRDIYRDMPVSGMKEVAATTLGLYPNPTTKQLNLKSSAEMLAYQIVDAAGKVSRSGKLTDKEINLDVETLPAGLYQISIVGKNGFQNKSFYKQ